MGGLVLWCVRRCFVDKSLIKVWSRSVRAEKFVPKLNGLGIWLSGPSMALLSDRNALDKKVFYAYIDTKWCGFWSCVHQMIVLFTCVLISKRIKVSFSIQCSNFLCRLPKHLPSHYRIFWPWGPGGLSRECAPPYPQRDRKRRLNGAVCRNHRIKGWSRVGARTGTLKNPTKCLWRWEPTVGQLLLQSACTSMCRHIYDWNIVNCDVKQ